MATPNSGPISMSQVRLEATGATSGAISFSNAAVRRMAMYTMHGGDTYLSQPAAMGNMRGVAYLRSNQQNLTLTSVLAPSAARQYKLIIPPGISVGGTYGNYAINVGTFPAGSSIVIVCWGNILGHYGPIGQGTTSGYGQQGGGCVYAAYGSQWTGLYIKPGGQVYSGGGGGGKGGYGGAGGQGGTGYYVATAQEGPSSEATTHGVYRYVSSTATYWKWHAAGWPYQNYFSSAGDGTNQVNIDQYRYYRHTNVGVQNDPVFGFYNIYEIYRQWDYNVYTSGGAGGNGGTGGDGGYGQGWDQAQTGPTNGGLTAGSPGAGGGVNAGGGGTGGTGGVGGWGGGWGAYGFTGATGDAGGGGGNGNAAGGNPGAGGGGGYPGGPPGYWFVAGGGPSGANNEGSVAGLTA